MHPRPASPARRAELARLEAELTDLQSFGIRAEPVEYLRRANAFAARARLQDFLPLHIGALHVLADAQSRNEQSPELTLRELATAAARAGDERSAALAWSSLVRTLVFAQRFDAARQLLDAARAAATRGGATEDLTYNLRLATGTLACELDDFAGCDRDLGEAQALASTPTRKLNALHSHLVAYMNRGQYEKARPLVDAYLTLAEAVAGTHHPTYADGLEMRSILQQSSGDPADLQRSYETRKRLLEIRVGAFGETHPDVARTWLALAHNAGHRAAFDDAEKAARSALAIGEALQNRDIEADALRVLAPTITRLRGIKEARPSYERSIAILRDLYGPDSMHVAKAAAGYAIDLQEAGECAAVATVAAEAIRILDAAGAVQVVLPLLARGLCALDGGELEAGFADLERAATLCKPDGSCVTGHRETIESYLGIWLLKTGRDRARGKAYVVNARKTYEQMGRAEDVAAMDEVLAEHGR
jgi:tetratricopeptide (TPR) repeat protein